MMQWFKDLVEAIGKKPWIIFVVFTLAFAYIIYEQNDKWDKHIAQDTIDWNKQHAENTKLSLELGELKSDKNHNSEEIARLKVEAQKADELLKDFVSRFGEVPLPAGAFRGTLPPAPVPTE